MTDGPGSREAWAYDYITTASLTHKLAPPPLPATWGGTSEQRLTAPGRPPELTIIDKSPRSPGSGALQRPRDRARILHTFLHHELQAAELMCWAALAFPDTPEAFRSGLLGIALDEVRHMNLYRGHIEQLGCQVGEFGVRDWFWAHVTRCTSPTQFVALLGIGFEGGNLDHATVWAQRFTAAGDEPGAAIQRQVGREEVAHVRFALKWFAEWTGGVSFDTWLATLPPPLSPIVMRGRSIHRALRKRAGFNDDFLDALEAWSPSPGS